jgi:lipid II isoglutaminyl synthase (glutamine-hydrolysing)
MIVLEQARLAAAVTTGKLAGAVSQRFGIGGGTNFPGVVARRIAPSVLRRLTRALPQGVVLLSGTNGKTTTARMLASMLERHGLGVLHNRAGANLVSGLTATALAHSSPWGRPYGDIGLFETDEAALPQALAETQPRLVIVHNLFRDQLDRYGEVDTIAGRWKTALATLPPTATVLLNADDPAVAYLGAGLACRVVYYGVEDRSHDVGGVQSMADSQFCQRCGSAYDYATVFYGHVGHYRCPNCGLARPHPHIRLERLLSEGTRGSRLLVAHDGGALEIRLPLPGFYNAANALAACGAALQLGVSPHLIRASLEQFSAAFGRIERIDANGRELLLALIKNPVGASETVRMITEGAGAKGQEPEATTARSASVAAGLHLFVVINDRDADGTDVSWLWDAEFERLAGVVAQATVSGTRAGDMAVRLKYAGVAPARVAVEPDLARALDAALMHLPQAETLYVLPTYTAMLELRTELARRGWVRQFWQD